MRWKLIQCIATCLLVVAIYWVGLEVVKEFYTNGRDRLPLRATEGKLYYSVGCRK